MQLTVLDKKTLKFDMTYFYFFIYIPKWMFKYCDMHKAIKKGILKRKYYLNAKQPLLSSLFTVFVDFKLNFIGIIKQTKINGIVS